MLFEQLFTFGYIKSMRMEDRKYIAVKTNPLKRLPLCKKEENNIFVECENFVNFICDNVKEIKNLL